MEAFGFDAYPDLNPQNYPELGWIWTRHTNFRDKITGDTLLHHAVANCDKDTILKILQKGADVTLKNYVRRYNYKKEKCSQSVSRYLPLEIAVEGGKSRLLFYKI